MYLISIIMTVYKVLVNYSEQVMSKLVNTGLLQSRSNDSDSGPGGLLTKVTFWPS